MKKYYLIGGVILAVFLVGYFGIDAIKGIILGLFALIAGSRVRRKPVEKTYKPSVKVDMPKEDKAAEKRSEAFREIMDKTKHLVLILLLLPNLCLADVTFSDAAAKRCREDVQMVMHLLETPPDVNIKSMPDLSQTGQVIKTETPLKFDISWPEFQTYPAEIDLGLEAKVLPPPPSWWEKNDFTFGFVAGGVAVSVGFVGLFMLAK